MEFDKVLSDFGAYIKKRYPAPNIYKPQLVIKWEAAPLPDLVELSKEKDRITILKNIEELRLLNDPTVFDTLLQKALKYNYEFLVVIFEQVYLTDKPRSDIQKIMNLAPDSTRSRIQNEWSKYLNDTYFTVDVAYTGLELFAKWPALRDIGILNTFFDENNKCLVEITYLSKIMESMPV